MSCQHDSAIMYTIYFSTYYPSTGLIQLFGKRSKVVRGWFRRTLPLHGRTNSIIQFRVTTPPLLHNQFPVHHHPVPRKRAQKRITSRFFRRMKEDRKFLPRHDDVGR